VYEHLAGTLERIAGEIAVVEVAGVGYRLKVPSSTAQTLRAGCSVKLFVTHRFQNEVFHLYGFASREEREVFDRVCSVTGVGPAIGLAILSSLPIDQFRGVVLRGESKALEKIKGVGKKTAQRLILELRGVLEESDLCPAESAVESGPADDAVKALISLGFHGSEAESRVRTAIESSKGSLSVADLVRLATRG